MALDDEVRLVARILSGDAGAIEQFVADYRRFVYGILTRQSNLRPEEAEEVFQRFLFHIWEDRFRRLREWSGQVSVAAYLAAIARNLARDYLRETRLRDRDNFPDASIESDAFEKAIRREMIEAALSELSPRDRELIYRRHYLGQSYREISEALRMTTNNAGVALYRAESRLKKILSKKYPDILL